jgi:hypothetical protein
MKDYTMHDFDMYLMRCHQLRITAHSLEALEEGDEELCACANLIKHEEKTHSLTPIEPVKE